MPCRAITVSDLAITMASLAPDQVIDGSPEAGALEVVVPRMAAIEVGVWEHSVGTSTDIEADEVFVVVSGRATVVASDGTTLDLAPGVIGVLEAGVRTTWTVHETLRKVYVTPR